MSDMEVRPIDANALKEKMDEILMPGKDAVMETYVDEVVCAVIDDAPTLDYAPVRHGEWIPVRNHYGECCGVKCRECGRRVRNKGENYCPSCGAKMGGGEKA